MRARAVIGANFGDEGKGLVTDYLCAQGAGVVVRFNGGAQAGHTVVTPEGQRAVFSHLGAGTFLGVPTFLSQFFICNPILFFREWEKLGAILPVEPEVFAHPDCIVTTFADMIINQRLESKRADGRHGSCGVGIGETVDRSRVAELKITMSDLWNKTNSLPSRLEQICQRYATFRTGSPINEPQMMEAFIQCCWKFAERVAPAGIGQCRDPVFEGAQGLLLDQHNKQYFPHVTRSNTGMRNIRTLCAQAKIEDIETYYVSRTYLTRHGAGPLPGEDPNLHYEDQTNVPTPWQGRLRFAPLDKLALIRRCKEDYGGTDFKLALTHCDQVEPTTSADLFGWGPTRESVGGTCLEPADMGWSMSVEMRADEP